MTVQRRVLVARDEGEHFHFLNTVYTAKINSEQSLGAVTAMEFLAPAKLRPGRFIATTSRTNSSTSSMASCGSPAATLRPCTARARWGV